MTDLPDEHLWAVAASKYGERLRRLAPSSRYQADMPKLKVPPITNDRGPVALAHLATWQGFDAKRADAPVADNPYQIGASPAQTWCGRAWLRGFALAGRRGGQLRDWDPTPLIAGPK